MKTFQIGLRLASFPGLGGGGGGGGGGDLVHTACTCA